MGKGANKQLLANAGTAQGAAKTDIGNANNIFGYLDPTLTAEAQNPQGYTPAEMADFNTAAQQSVGGSVAGTVGEANLEAARTRNAGGFQGAIGSSSRDAMRTLSADALDVQNKNAMLKQQKQQNALNALQSLYGMDTNAAVNFLNSSNSALGEENRSHPLQQGVLTTGTFIDDLTKGGQQGADAAKTIENLPG